MKKICLICATALVGMSLTACGSQLKSASSSSKTSSSKVVKHHKKQAKKDSKKQDSTSSNSSSANNSSSQQGNQQTQSNGSQQASSNNGAGQLPPSSDLHDFVNRYGESPAAYMMDHYGMSQQQALNSTPDNMKSSGELQYQEGIRQGYIQP